MDDQSARILGTIGPLTDARPPVLDSVGPRFRLYSRRDQMSRTDGLLYGRWHETKERACAHLMLPLYPIREEDIGRLDDAGHCVNGAALVCIMSRHFVEVETEV